MNERNRTRDLVVSGLMLALGVIIPYIFHSTGIPGTMFLPMHIPVFIGGFLLPPYLAFALGILTPIINSLATGMPKLLPIGIIMIFELGTYGLLTSILYRKIKLPPIIVMILAMLGGRIMGGLGVFILAIFLEINLEPITYVIGAITAGIPGILIQVFILPILIHAITRYTNIDLDY